MDAFNRHMPTENALSEAIQEYWQEDIDRLFWYVEDQRYAENLHTIRFRSSQFRRSLCVRCTKNFVNKDVISASCGHLYCRKCITNHFQAFVNGKGKPVKCCRQVIQLKSVKHFLPKDLTGLVTEKLNEITDPRRTYCSRPTCGWYLRMINRNDKTRYCKRCDLETCTACQEQTHDGKYWKFSLKRRTRRRKWRLCSQCGDLVEKDEGSKVMM
ncbi:RBR family RING finger protein [Aspergillus tanneri]|uniref:RING-type domain-containing protein n=1 Tax=Aspergillus tanneri TaxID=1220188 RepID=A0A5M9MC55_9EURO|nr:uncharacterized protein ATNIH1004_008702 [Aspergillus tanneri]KAA8644498.1 hypothetical protein ATNIH1004_008702 [Aspergillus tanneri]